MAKRPLKTTLLPRDKRWLKLFVMAEALGPPPSVKKHPRLVNADKPTRQTEDSKL